MTETNKRFPFTFYINSITELSVMKRAQRITELTTPPITCFFKQAMTHCVDSGILKGHSPGPERKRAKSKHQCYSHCTHYMICLWVTKTKKHMFLV